MIRLIRQIDSYKTKNTIERENMKYQHKRTGKIGTVVFDGITKTLRFEDGSEEILTPANIRNDWKFVEEKSITFDELCETMRAWNKAHDANKAQLFGIIVYAQSNFENQYSEKDRSYKVSNTAPRFRTVNDASLIGDCLDGIDLAVYLDMYDWTIDYCYMLHETGQ